MRLFSRSIAVAGAGLLWAGMVAMAQTTTTRVMQLASPQASTRPVVTKTVVPATATGRAQYTKIVTQSGAATQRTQSVKVTVKQGTATTPAATRTVPVAKPAFRPRPHFAPAPTVVSSVNFGSATVGGSPVILNLSFPADSVSNGSSSVVANGATAPGSVSDYIFFGNQHVEFGQQGGGQPQNLTNFTVSTLNNVEYPGNGNYTKITAPDGTGPFTTGTVTENPTNYPNTTPHTTLLATFSPLNAGSFTVYILDGNTDGVYVGNSTVSLGVNGGPAVATATHVVSGKNEFTRYNVANASPSDVFQVYATTSTNAYPTIGGLTFSMGTASQSLTALTAAGTDFKVSSLYCMGSVCSAQVTFTPGFPGLRYDSVQLTDNLGNLVYQTYVYGVGQAPQFGYEFGNLTIYSGYGGENPLGVAIGPDEQLYYTSTGSSTIYQFPRDFSSSNSFNLDGLTTPSGIVVDGSNTLYVADRTNNDILFRTSGDIQGTVATSPLSGPSQLAIDGTGALYIADTGNNRVIKIDNQGNETTVANGLNAPSGVAVDSAGDVFIADQANGGEILEFAAGSTTPTTFESELGLTTLNLAVDASGTVFLTSVEQGFNVYRSNGTNESSYATGGDIPSGLALDRNGDILLTNPLKNQFVVFDRTSSNFILNAPPNNSSNGGVTITNTGNMPLTFGTFTTTGPEFTVDPNNNQCASQGTLQPASDCNLQIDFTPPLAQYYTDTMIATSNSLNVPGTKDPFYLAGNGQGAPSTTTLSAAPTAVQAGNAVELLVTVSDSPMTFTPTGQITFMDGSSVLGTATLTAGSLADTATATLTTTSLSVGSHSITAVYAGDLNVDNGTSKAVTVTVYTGAPPANGGVAVTTQNFGSVPIQNSASTGVRLPGNTFSVSVVGVDYSGGELGCDVNCSVTVSFYPQFPGLRTGALLAFDSGGNLLAKVLLNGIGTGPLLGFDPGNTTLYSGTVGAPGAEAFGPDRSLYLADNATNEVFLAVNNVFQDSQNPPPITQFPIVNLGAIGGLAVDGGNKVYVSDQTHNLIVTYDPSLASSSAQSTIPTSPLSSPAGVAVDGAGNLYIADTGHSRIIEIDNQGNETTVTSNAANVGPLALDSAGDLYYAITANSGSILSIPAGGGSPTVVASNISGIQGLAVDAANRVYYTNAAGASIVPLPSCSGCPIEGFPLAGFPAQALTGILVDQSGDIFATQPSTGYFALSVRAGGNSTVTGPVGTTTPGSPFLVSNVGNTPLSITGISFQNASIFSANASSTCSSETMLQPGSICNIVPNFTPAQAQQYSASVTFTSNELNVPGTTDSDYTLYGRVTVATGVNLTASPNSVKVGQTLTLTATVVGATSATPAGTVQFLNGTTVLGSQTLSPSSAAATATAVFTTSALSPSGTYSLTAKYLGDSNNPVTTSPAQQVVVTVASSTTAISVSSMQLNSNQSETLTATITSLSSPSLTGTVTFFDGDGQVGQGTVTSTANGGTATLTLSNLSVGTHHYSATYDGDQNYGLSSSGTVAVHVTSATPPVNSQSFGSVAVGGSASMPVTVGGAGSTYVVSGMTPTLSITDTSEFAPTSDPNCTSACSITIKFTPTYPGLRMAAITALDSNGNVQAKTFLYGTGTAPQLAFDPGSTGPAFSAPDPVGLAIASNGTVYVSDLSSNSVVQHNANGSSATVPLGTIGSVGAVAVDGSGTVYVVDNNAAQIVASSASGATRTVSTSPLGRNGTSGPPAIAVDGTGALYINDAFNQRIIKIDNQGNETRLASTTNSAGLAVDASGNVFYGDTTSSGSGIFELPTTGGAAVTLVSGLSAAVTQLAIDPAGRVYFIDGGRHFALFTPGTSAPTVYNSAANTSIAVDGMGRIYVGEPNAEAVEFYYRSNDALFITAQVGTTGQGIAYLSNTGNTVLTVSALTFTDANYSIDPTSACVAGSTIAPAQTCLVKVDFTPVTNGYDLQQLYVTSNSLNASAANANYALTGQGIGTVASTTSLTTSSSNPTFGQQVTFTATVADSSQITPTGTVSFLDGTVTIGSQTLSGTGGTAQAQFSTATLAVGGHSITAVYSGDTNVGGSTSNAQTVTVAPAGPAATSIVFSTSAGDPNAYERPVSLLATVTSSGAPVTNGQVIFCETSAPHCNLTTNLGLAQLNSAGLATLRIDPGVIGPHTYQAIFLGTNSYQAAASDSQSLTVGGMYPSVTAITSGGSAGNYSLTANVAGIGSRGNLATGTVSFVDTTNGNAALGTGTLGYFSTGFSEVKPTGSPVGVGRQPYGAAAADLNGDGFTDLVVENYGGGTVSVLIGNGDGTFAPAATYAVGSAPEGVKIADFNGDGYPDLVVANTGSNTVSVLINNGDGTFKPQATYAASSPVGLGVMDLNHDGIADIVASDYYSNTVSVLLGNGDGTFKAAVTYATGRVPQTLAEGDFNGDGNVDLVVGNLSDNNVSVYLGNGDGTFQSRATYAVGSGPQGVQVGDFNNDGIADLAVSNSNAGTVSVLLGKGDGTFLSQIAYTVGSSPVGLAIADFNGDGNQDITVSNTSQSSLSQGILLGNGDGTFQAALSYPTGNFPYSEAVGDFNGDGYPDIGVSNFNDGTVTIFLSQITQTSTATITGVALSGAAGTHTVDAVYSGNTGYSTSTSPTIPLQSGSGAPASQTIAFSSIPNHTFGDAPFMLNATASSGLAVSYTVLSGPATVSGSTVTLTGAGMVTIQASQAGNASYAAAIPVSQSFTVAQASQTIAFPAIPNHTVGDAPFMLAATASSGLAVSYSVVSGPATISGSTVTVTGAGTVTIQASQAGNANYSAATPVSQSFTVSLAPQTITFAPIPNHTFGDASFTLGATASSGLTVSYAVTAGPATVSGNTVTLTGAGTVTIQATQAGNTTYAAATPVSQSFSVAPASQTITFPAIPNHTVSDPPFNLSATASSGLAVSYAVTSGPATVSGSTVTVTGAGTVVIAASQAGNANYSAAAPVSQTFSVTLASQTITFPAIPNHTFGDAPFALNATASSGLTVSYSIVSGPATIAGNTVSITGAGTVTIQATQAGNTTNYAAATPVSQSFSVAQAPQSITFPVIPNHTVGDAAFALNATASSGLAVTYAVASGPATLAGNTVTVTGAGTVTIQATQSGNMNYAAATPVSQSFTVALRTQTMTFPAIPNHTLGDAPFTLNATASSGLTVAYAVSSGPATISGNTVTLTGTGTVAIQATQAGNSTYAAATPVTQSFLVLPPPPALTNINPTGGVVGSGATTITLTGTNFAATDTVQLNATALATKFVSATTLTAIVPASFLTAAGTVQVTVFDSVTNSTTSAQSFSVQAAPAINFTGPTTTGSATQPALTFQLVNPYPFPITGSLTLTFTPSGTTGVDDPAIQFSTGGRTLLYTIPALSQATPTIQIQTGTVAGVATVTLAVTSNGINVTPANVTPLQIAIPAAVPALTSSTVTRSGTTLTVVIEGFSNTRELATAIFHFTAAPGSSVSTPDITAPVGTVFANYFSSNASTPYGSTFVYMQNFTLNNDASSIQSVTVTLVNSVGMSVQVTSQ